MGTRVFGILLALTVTAAAQNKVEIVGKAVDTDGKPIAGASVATFWAEGKALSNVTTDQEGRFKLEADHHGRPIAILVMDAERKRGAVSRFSDRSFGKERTLKLEPLVKVHGKFTCKDLKKKPPWTNVYVNALPGKIRVARHSSHEAEFSFLLPPGDYQLYMYGTDTTTITREQFVNGDEGAINLKTVNLPATNLAKMYGKKAPAWNVTDARGVKRNVRLSDYRGKYVLLEFWGYW